MDCQSQIANYDQNNEKVVVSSKYKEEQTKNLASMDHLLQLLKQSENSKQFQDKSSVGMLKQLISTLDSGILGEKSMNVKNTGFSIELQKKWEKMENIIQKYEQKTSSENIKGTSDKNEQYIINSKNDSQVSASIDNQINYLNKENSNENPKPSSSLNIVEKYIQNSKLKILTPNKLLADKENNQQEQKINDKTIQEDQKINHTNIYDISNNQQQQRQINYNYDNKEIQQQIIQDNKQIEQIQSIQQQQQIQQPVVDQQQQLLEKKQTESNQSSNQKQNDENVDPMQQTQKPNKNLQRYYKLDQMYKTINVSDYVTVQQNDFEFGTVVPGYIMEESLDIYNNSTEYLALKVLVNVLNEDLAALDEYVYSVRKIQNYEYNEKQIILLAPYTSFKFKIALKVPSICRPGLIIGQVAIMLHNFEDKMIRPIRSTMLVPDITCPKSLLLSQEQVHVIKLQIKRGKKLEAKIPFRNNCKINFSLEFDFIKQNNMFDFYCQPAAALLPANQMAIVNLGIKEKVYIDKKLKIRTVLLIKIKNSSTILSFPIEIQLQ